VDLNLPEDLRRNKFALWGLFWTLILGVFFLGLFLIKQPAIQRLISPIPAYTKADYEVFGFAPFWTLSKLSNVDWGTLTTFAYFSIPVNADGSFDRESYEWQVFEGDKLAGLFEKAKENNVRRVVTLTQMDKATIETFLEDEQAWDRVSQESIEVLAEKNLDGVNIDFEYIPSDPRLRAQFSKFAARYTQTLKQNLNNPYVTVSVLASSERFNKIYDIASLSKSTDAIFMMAYDFYYPGSEKAGPAAPLYGFNEGKGPFWYDVSTAVTDFLKVADPNKIIMGVPYYGWNYPAQSPAPNSDRVARAFATTNAKASDNNLLSVTPVGGWDSQAQVSWRGYWDNSGWHVVYMEDEKSLSLKYEFAKKQGLAGVGIWALGFDSASDRFWSLLSSTFKNQYLSDRTIISN